MVGRPQKDEGEGEEDSGLVERRVLDDAEGHCIRYEQDLEADVASDGA